MPKGTARRIDANRNLSAMLSGGQVAGFSAPRRVYSNEDPALRKPGFEMFTFKMGRQLTLPAPEAVRQQDDIWKTLLERIGPSGWSVMQASKLALLTACPLDTAEAIRKSDKNKHARSMRDTIQAIGKRTLGLTESIRPVMTSVAFADKSQQGQSDVTQIKGIYGLQHQANRPLIDEQLIASEEIALMLGYGRHEFSLSEPYTTLATINTTRTTEPIDQILQPLVMNRAEPAGLEFEPLDAQKSFKGAQTLNPSLYLRSRVEHSASTVPADGLLSHAARLGYLMTTEQGRPYVKAPGNTYE